MKKKLPSIAVLEEVQFQCESLEQRMMLSTVQLLAAGADGTEQMQLQINGTAVQTWTLPSGANAGVFQPFIYESAGTVTPDQIRVEFLNDTYDPANNIDSNLRLDAVVIDGQRYETEDPSVFSTGSWLPADGIVPGNRQSEFLNANGYFQFANTNTGSVQPLTPGSVIINEIHYNPGPAGADPDSEFLELYNTTANDIDLSGASFVGFSLVFAQGTTLGAGQYAIVSPSTAIAQSTWGVTPIAQFASGGLSGSGELIQLLAADGTTVIDEVNFLDRAPWSPGPDGNGPSLELRSPTLDNSLAANWGASIGNPTPGAVNSIVGTEQPAPITNIVVTPGTVLPGQSFNISANIVGATTANLIYKIGFAGAEQSVAMTNVGDVWTGTLPGQDSGQLVRYRIVSDVAVAPFNDSITFFSLVVSNPDIVDNTLPLVQFWVDDAQFQELTTTDLRLTNTKIPAVVAFGNQVFENATVRVRGGDFARTNYPKLSLKFELPTGHTFDIGTEDTHLIDEFGMNADFGDWSQVTPDVSWDVFNAETDSFTASFFMRAQRNGNFHGIFRFQELYDDQWQKANGFTANDQLLEAQNAGFSTVPDFDKKYPDDGDISAIVPLNDVLMTSASAAKTAYLYRHVDIASVVNHIAISSLMRHDDQRGQNFYMKLDAETQIWKIIEWDVDRTWVVNEDVPDPFTTPEIINNPLFNAIWEVPEFREMYWRRMQTIVDTWLSDDRLINRHEALLQQIGATNSALEFAKWNRNDIYANRYWQQEFNQAVQLRREAYAAETRMPGSASGNYNIVINELHYNPLSGDAEFLELFNNSTESVDLSGWTIDAVGLKIAYGTVILPGQSIVFTDNITRFQAEYSGNILVGGQYSGGLSGSGERVALVDAAGNLRDVVEYSDSGAWPTAPDGTGFTLALSNPNLDNSLASSWTASSQINGTPGLPNDVVIQPNVVKIFAAGDTGNEIVTLEIAGQVVATYRLSDFGGQAGDLANRRFVELSYASPTTVNISDVRINFTNDTYDPANSIDYNVAIDRIEIAQAVYETEAPDVYSTGTYTSPDGVVPGFRLSEVLNVNGYFQYGGVGQTNRAPVAAPDSIATAVGQPVTINVLGNDSDPDAGDTIAIDTFTQAANGAVALAGGSLVYTPNAGFTGNDTFSYTIIDSRGARSTASVNVTVTPDQTNAIRIYAAGVTGNEIISLEIAGQTVATYRLADFGGRAGDLANRNFIALTYSSPTPVNISDVRINFTNDVYDPTNNIDYNVAIDRIEIGNVAYQTEAADVFSTGTWLAADGIVPGFRQSEVLHTNGYFQYGVVDTNAAPTALADSASTAAGQPVTINVLGNDSDPDAGDTLSISGFTQAANGSVAQSGNSLVYTPNSGFSGTDSFSYTIVDPSGATSTASVSVNVSAPPPVIANGNTVQLFNVANNAWLRGNSSLAQTTTTNDTRTQWQLISAGSDTYRLRNVSSGRYLDGDLLSVDMNSLATATGTIWRFVPAANGGYYLFNLAYNRYLDTNGSNTGVTWDIAPLESDDIWRVNLV